MIRQYINFFTTSYLPVAKSFLPIVAGVSGIAGLIAVQGHIPTDMKLRDRIFLNLISIGTSASIGSLLFITSPFSLPVSMYIICSRGNDKV